ncbi:alpha/beta hydrolase [Bacillus sp. FJAT-50079]|uniref:alpha/beta fold hydrolase n=1 Tax=Bacillus sp. FJAT-50079 TaxID=2833577 RepID=UPI001BC9071E|nr:alpha/beta hydrolase [Bacillus sp. FJAT-50079]
MQAIRSSQHVFINGNEIYYEEYKQPYSAPTFILIHGFLSSSFSFRKLIPLLANDSHVISIDLPPFGKSGKSLQYEYSYRNIAKSIFELLDGLATNERFAVGHSMGGQIVLNMLHQRPDFIKKAILLSSSGYIPRAKPLHIFFSHLPFLHHYVKFYLHKTGVLGNLKVVVHDQTLIDDTMVAGYSEPFDDPQIFRALTRLLRHREGDLSSAMLRTIETPCLLIYGQYDRVVPVKIGKRLAHDLPAAQLVAFENVGHLLPEEAPEKVYREIMQFISDK